MDITINHTGPQVPARPASAAVQSIVYLPQEAILRVEAGFGPLDFDLADDHPLAVALAAYIAE